MTSMATINKECTETTRNHPPPITGRLTCRACTPACAGEGWAMAVRGKPSMSPGDRDIDNHCWLITQGQALWRTSCVQDLIIKSPLKEALLLALFY